MTFRRLSGIAVFAGFARVLRAQGSDAAAEGNLSTVDRALDLVFRILTMPLIEVQGAQLTPLKLLVAFTIFMAGAYVSRRFAEAARHRILGRFELQRSYTFFLERLFRILLLAIFGLVALQFAGIPVTVFAFLGGALAIAVGFGGQELLANFIGGVILMFEKPIREGDLVEFDGNRGRVEEIGPRSTRLSMPGNVDLLVPNRLLLENKIVNWTLTDDLIRSDVTVGIAYGSDTRLFASLLLRATDEQDGVVDEPEPVVLFEDFGADALVFTVYFWVAVKNFMDQRRICSSLRFRIDELCREHGVVIAFPQRDVHLDAPRPIDVRVVGTTPG